MISIRDLTDQGMLRKHRLVNSLSSISTWLVLRYHQ